MWYNNIIPCRDWTAYWTFVFFYCFHWRTCTRCHVYFHPIMTCIIYCTKTTSTSNIEYCNNVTIGFWQHSLFTDRHVYKGCTCTSCGSCYFRSKWFNCRKNISLNIVQQMSIFARDKSCTSRYDKRKMSAIRRSVMRRSAMRRLAMRRSAIRRSSRNDRIVIKWTFVLRT